MAAAEEQRVSARDDDEHGRRRRLARAVLQACQGTAPSSPLSTRDAPVRNNELLTYVWARGVKRAVGTKEFTSIHGPSPLVSTDPPRYFRALFLGGASSTAPGVAATAELPAAKSAAKASKSPA